MDELLLKKTKLEAAMLGSPADYAIRREYFAVLMQISYASFGSFFAHLPEIKTPVLFRGGTSDIWNLQQIFLLQWHDADFHYGDYGFPIPTPRRILDLAAYSGYTGVYFANRFPAAEILCIEPAEAIFAALRANTAAYPNISCERAAVWHERAVLHTAGNFLGDWGTHFGPPSGTSADIGASVPGYTIAELLERHGWPEVDLIKCSMQGDQTRVLGGPTRPWLDGVKMITTRPAAGVWSAGEMEALLAAFPDRDFVKTEENDDILVIQRRSPIIDTEASSLRLLPVLPQRRAFTLTNIVASHGFYQFGQTGIQLLANPPGSPPATVAFRLLLDGQSRFVAQLGTGPAPGGTSFRLRISSAASGSEIVAARHVLAANAEFGWSIGFDPLFGPHERLLSTERVASEDTAADATRRSFFSDARLL